MSARRLAKPFVDFKRNPSTGKNVNPWAQERFPLFGDKLSSQK